jgi:hypothetical protein
VWDGTGDNPYFAFLALSDAIVATEDSINMVTEAAGTGKPVYVQRLKGNSRRLARFHELMQERGATRPFEGKLESWTSRRSTTPKLWRRRSGAPSVLKPNPNSHWTGQPANRVAQTRRGAYLLSSFPR